MTSGQRLELRVAPLPKKLARAAIDIASASADGPRCAIRDRSATLLQTPKAATRSYGGYSKSLNFGQLRAMPTEKCILSPYSTISVVGWSGSCRAGGAQE